jgi:undecaprenyl-diphosphatase
MELPIWEKKLFLFLNQFHWSWLDPVMEFSSGHLIWIPPALTFLFIVRKSPKLPWIIILSLMMLAVSDLTSSYIFKNYFQRLRPCRMDEILPLIYSFGQKCGGKYGFISSHASNATAFVMFFLSIALIRIKWPFYLLLFLVVYSRLYLGVHFPMDLALGSFWGYLLAKLFFQIFLRTKEPIEIFSKKN